MGAWDTYEARFGASAENMGEVRRGALLNHSQSRIQRKITASLSYKGVLIAGTERQVSIADVTGDYTTKKIYSLPGEDLPHGALLEWADNVWLITEVDAHKELYTEGLMRRCNYYLKWIDDKGDVIGRWCIVEDGTKYLIGERRSELMTIGDARIAVTIGKDADTSKLARGKRFLIDDMDAGDQVLAYEITKPNKLFNVYNGKGVFRFILNETNMTDDDNADLRIADFYSWTPKHKRPTPDNKVDSTLVELIEDAREKNNNIPEDIEKRKVWL